MTEASDFISRNKTLGGRRLRDALDAARGEVIGGPGIKVNSVGGKTVVSLKGQRIIKGAKSDIIIARIIAVNGAVNATYDVESIRPPIITLTNVTPINRFFALDSSGNAQVDFLAAPVADEFDIGKSMAKIIKYSGTATGTIASGDGACSFGGDCAITDPALCASLGGVFVEGLQCPGLVVEITENVKISVCPVPSPALRPPPPVVSQIAGVLP